ncbi:endonuclease/exonuclease/phosphatase family protein [Mesonia mobilis]|uniref:Endonuclease n=1 Tax=Mesonia mobilis TaxID=369791 RepID=A0ABQ3BJ60_9FLAO|nr:endonuclease/exonuclease/phosphatase family protein [Mesonia mobilis]MBQ0736813.1 endonuclease/exonuclease/phosphatase family protein [Aquimarina celericrescens]GGZ47431.1 endonuclease [Mesonia mobilis]
MKKLIVAIIFMVSSFGLLAQEFTAMSYNIKYANENDGENSWSKRKDFLANQLKFYHPQIFGVQEAVKSQIDFITAELSNYQHIGVGREGGDQGEFSAIFYDTTKFEVLKSDTFWLSETPNQISKGWDADYHRICTYALLKDKESSEKFYFFNTHFDHRGKDARTNSSRLITQQIKKINVENYPVLLTGDFNLEPETEQIQYIKSYLKDAKDYSAGIKLGPSGTFNGYDFKTPVTRRIDYIFHSEEVKIKTYAVLSDNEDGRYASDHLPVFVKIILK